MHGLRDPRLQGIRDAALRVNATMMSTPTPPATAPGVDGLNIASFEKKLTTRIQRLHVFKAPGDAPLPEAITWAANASAAPELLELDEDDGWVDMGLVGSDDAPTVTRDMDQSDLTAIGFRDPVRSDLTEDTASFTAVFLEKRRSVIETYDNIDMSGIRPDPVTGEIKWIRPPDGPMITSRYALYGEDGAGADRIWMVKILTAGILEEVDDQVWGGEDYTTFPVTIKGLTDPIAGTSMVNFLGGPGLKAVAASMGFAA